MALAIFGITNNGLNLAATLFLLALIVVWLALIVYTYLDARRRISDPFLIACATVASFFPFIGTAVYAIVRPPEYLEDAHERELEIKAAELRVRQLRDQTCPNCEYPVEKNFLRCPNCQRRLKDPCPTCSKPVDPRWALCPYCETSLGGGEKPRRSQKRGRRPEGEPRRSEGEPRRSEPRREPEGSGSESGQAPPKRQQRPKKAPSSSATRAPERAERSDPERQPPAKEPSTPNPDQRSPSREPDPDPRQA
ncbi:MAG: zinc ribbon domain-containing protein [Solirubrobacterales bacterium]|nr:zinc ribbon domain-containing protein [Solirubrobacterales bacterium]